MARGVGLDVSQQLLRHGLLVEIRAHQQARAGRRGERHGHRQLRVVAAAETRIGLRPGEVEYELAVGVALAKCRHRGGEPLCCPSA